MDRFRAWMARMAAGLRASLVRFMQGRRGPDELAAASLYAGIAVALIGSLTGFFPLYLAGYALEMYALFRMLSRQVLKRAGENSRFVAWAGRTRRDVKAFFLRIRLRRKYKYFRCPGCRSLMRLARGRGQVEMTCPKCHRTFSQKA